MTGRPTAATSGTAKAVTGATKVAATPSGRLTPAINSKVTAPAGRSTATTWTRTVRPPTPSPPTLAAAAVARPTCLFFQQGNCAKGSSCPYLHAQKVADCRAFLQGRCRRRPCAFNHTVDESRRPACPLFLRATCLVESCPYLHVKLPAAAGPCVAFRTGSCPRGRNCDKVHARECPTLVVSGQCADSACPFGHSTRAPAPSSRSSPSPASSSSSSATAATRTDDPLRVFGESGGALGGSLDSLLPDF